MTGNCRLCGRKAELQNSHIWPKFAYKAWVSDLPRGGSFIDIVNRCATNRQLRRYWFCRSCEQRIGKFEDYTASFCRQLTSATKEPIVYDAELLCFVTSISLRVALLNEEAGEPRWSPSLRRARQQWKDYLLDRKKDVRPYSQHLLINVDPTPVGWHKVLGGEVILDAGLIHSQVGPLLMIGLLGRKGISLRGLKIWEWSELRPKGGAITPIQEWRVGENVPTGLAKLLKKHQARAIKQVRGMPADL